MINLDELRAYLTNLFENIPDYCPNGLQVEGKDKIKTIATAVTADLDTIKKAVEMKVDALIVHHGLFWQGDSFVIDGTKKNRLEYLFESGMSLFAYHLPLDIHPEIGNNWKAAKDMGWTNLEPFGNIGVKGTVPASTQEKFKKILEKYYNHFAVTALGGNKKITSAALISGGAYKSIHEAIQQGIDAFITGSFDEPAWSLAFEGNINFYALGHTATERIGPLALCKKLKNEVLKNSVFIDTNNPF